MLTLKEFEEITKLSKKIKTVKALLKMLDDQFTDKDPVQESFKDLRKMKNCVGPTRKGETSPATKSSEFELKNFVKVRTPAASEESDHRRGQAV